MKSEEFEEWKQKLTDAWCSEGWSSYVSSLQGLEEIRRCVWEGQSKDGRAWEENFQARVKPWDGAADSRIRLADQVGRELTAVLKTAFWQAKIQAVGRDLNDVERGQRVTLLLQYFLYTRMEEDLVNVLNLLGSDMMLGGLGVVAPGWRKRYGTRSRELSLEEFAEKASAAGLLAAVEAGEVAQTEQGPKITPIGQQIVVEQEADYLAFLTDAENEVEVAEMLQEIARSEVEDELEDGRQVMTLSEARQQARALREEGKCRVPVPYLRLDEPQWRVLQPGVEVFWPVEVTCLKESPWVAEREWLDEKELRARAAVDGWPESFVEAALEQKGVSMEGEDADILLHTDSEKLADDPEEERIQIHRVIYREIDENGFEGLREMVLHHAVEEPAYDEVLVHLHGEMPFRDFPLEQQTRRLMDSRGVPEIVTTWQMELKNQRDSRINRSDLETSPPRYVPANLLSGNPGRRVRPGEDLPRHGSSEKSEVRFMQLPAGRVDTFQIEDRTRAENDRYWGLVSDFVPTEVAQLLTQERVNDFLRRMKGVVRLTLQDLQQWMSPQVVTRVVGAPLASPFEVDREEIQGLFDVSIQFDARDMNTEFLFEKLKRIAEILALDSENVTDRGALMEIALRSVLPSAADQLIRPTDAVNAKEQELELQNLGLMMQGLEPPKVAGGQNHALRLQVLLQQVQGNAKVQEAIQEDEQVRAIFEARAQHHQHQLDQEENKKIGRTGARDVVPV
ncbi:MAG: hypothetical protein AAF555_05735 [Verrucomicrobiota bacterium]